jgi:hypothetical protein
MSDYPREIPKEIEELKSKLNELIKKFNDHRHHMVSEDLTDIPDEGVEELK